MERNTADHVRFADENERLDFFNDHILVHEKLVRSICSGILECRDDVDDAVQEALLSAWTKLDKLRDKDAARAWLCTIAKRCALDMKERNGKDLSISSENESGMLIEDLIAATVPGPEELLLRRNQYEALEAAYRMLPDKYRKLLYLRFSLCLDGSEIESIMGLENRGRINACYKAKLALRSNMTKLYM